MTDEPAYSRDDLDRMAKDWLERIDEAEKREKKWLDDAKNAEAAYLADDTEIDGALPDFNILHSNVETIVPSIINSTPQPDIRTRHQSRREDPVAQNVANILERVCLTMMDDSALQQEVEANAQDAFMAGRGIVRVKFDADVEEEIGVDMEGNEVPTGQTRVSNERVIYEVVSWDDYRCGPAKRWKDLPWEAYRHQVTETQLRQLEDEEIASQYEEVDEVLDRTIWEVWDKDTRKVYFVGAENAKMIAIKDDPLGLEQFFPRAEPIQPIKATKNLTPVCPYAIYEKLAKEVDRITKRINGIISGLKVRGIFIGDASIAQRVSNLQDWEIAPVENLDSLGAVGDLSKAVAWWPIEQAITVLRELYVQREQAKQAIYEVTGISDIVRGAGGPGKTATEQQIKTEWGSLRIKKMQRLIERQVRELIKLTVELVSKHFSTETLTQITGIQVDPQSAQLLQDPLQYYRVDVETDSTIRADLTKSREEMAQFLEATGGYFATMAPVVEQAPATAGPLVKLYSQFAMQYNLGKSAEDALDEFVALAEQAAANPPPNPEAERLQAEMQMKVQELQLKMQEMAQKGTLEQQKMQIDLEKSGVELLIKREELKIKREELGLKEAEAEVNAMMGVEDLDLRQEEMKMEKQQERAVKLGN